MRARMEMVESLLCCPRSGVPLFRTENGMANADGEILYEIVNDKPVLVDFDPSILMREDVMETGAQSQVKRTSFGPIASALKRLVSPKHTVTKENVRKLLKLLPKDRDIKVLSIGGGTTGQGMDHLFERPNVHVIAFDIYDSPGTHFVADGHDIPLIDGSIDLVIIQAVLEHVLVPQRVVDEIWRVLAKDGLVYAETPFLQHVHEGPYDFTRFTESGHRYLFRRFAIEKSGVVGGAGTQLLWSIDYFARGLFRSRIVGKAFKLAFFWLRFFDNLIPAPYSSDAASGVFFLGRKTDEIMDPEEIVDFYRGANL